MPANVINALRALKMNQLDCSDIVDVVKLERDLYMAGDLRSNTLREFLDTLWINGMVDSFHAPTRFVEYAPIGTTK